MFADITSANTVGFQTSNYTAGKYNMLNIGFEGTDGEGFKPNGGLTGSFNAGASYAVADHIEVYNPVTEGYDYYWLRSSSGLWVQQNARTVPIEDDFPTGIPAGTSVWILSQGEENPVATQAGAVLTQDDASCEVAAGHYNMFCNPYPVAWNPNDKDVVSWEGANAGASYAVADHIETYKAETEGYEYFWLRSATGLWVEQNARSVPYEDNNPPLDAATGNGLWYLSQGEENFDVVFQSPIKK